MEAFTDLGRGSPGWETPSWGGQAVMSKREPCSAGKPSGRGDGGGVWMTVSGSIVKRCWGQEQDFSHSLQQGLDGATAGQVQFVMRSLY